jgi:hypothetical protein
MTRLHAATLYWQYPDISWMTTFPRLDDRSKLVSSRDSLVPSIATLGDQLVLSLNQQWCVMFLCSSTADYLSQHPLLYRIRAVQHFGPRKSAAMQNMVAGFYNIK